MKRLVRGADAILAMSNVRGRNVTLEDIDFSFYYSPRNSSHGPRVKVVFDPFKMRIAEAGVQKLCDDWEFKLGKDSSPVSSKKIVSMQMFFKKYKILFLLVWDFKLDEPDPEDYLTGRMSLEELIQNLSFYDDYSSELDAITSIQELDVFCHSHDVVNMYGN